MVSCPICDKPVRELNINRHIDSECKDFTDEPTPPAAPPAATQGNSSNNHGGLKGKKKEKREKQEKEEKAKTFFTPASKKGVSFKDETGDLGSSPSGLGGASTYPPQLNAPPSTAPVAAGGGTKRHILKEETPPEKSETALQAASSLEPPKKKAKNAHAPLADRMRPRTLDEVAGQDLVGPNGVLRNLILSDRVPSMVLWGGPGTGKTTIARLIAQTAGTRFVEINSTSSGVQECKKIFAEAKNELGLTGRKTIIFCDEIHRFSKSQQDVFLGPVERGEVTLIGATTENPSFKVVNALLSRCRTFTLSKLTDEDVFAILQKALAREVPELSATPSSDSSADDQATQSDDEKPSEKNSFHLLTKDDCALVRYLANFADGDARTGLNLLELALDLCQRPGTTAEDIKASLTQTLVYDRAGDQHYDTISAFHKSVRGSSPDAALYYLARMLQSGEDPLYVARRMVVIASEDVGLADNTMLGLATSTYQAAEKIGMPECRINLAHCAVALSLAPKSTRAYRGLKAAYAALAEPGVAGLPIPIHLRNAPTKLMKELGYGREYKYNPDFVEGRVVQEYLPEKLEGRKFLGSKDLGDTVDPEVAEMDEQDKVAREYEGGGDEMLLNPDGD
ncbi:DNA replication ATPase [Hortaea werneckii]|nr:DNA replication ATPase [Hortaea werneckii]KAI7098291.1 DNA replication ATPase [Hortaea werneckii]KAI7231707.1 DNA replication ATPase [Hortaea werneckii]KAI7323448.1 DNA replication ATPase [Hortaea werneckii]